MGFRRGQGLARQWLLAHATHGGEECLIWPFSAEIGYGQFMHEQRHYYAHRYMCELVNGPPPTPEHQAAHSCGKGRLGCVNPKHLEWKTHGENQRDRKRHGTKALGWHARWGKGKFTPEQDAQIREMSKTMTRVAIARHFGVTHSTIQYRLYGGSYKPRRRRLNGDAG